MEELKDETPEEEVDTAAVDDSAAGAVVDDAGASDSAEGEKIDAVDPALAEAEEGMEPGDLEEEELSAEEIQEQARRASMKWYVLHTYSGYEKKVSLHLRERLKQHDMAEKVGDILVPEEDVMEVRSGKKRLSRRKFFPGYVVIEMDMDEDIWYVVKETPRVTGFLGELSPVPLSPDEVARLREQLSGAAEKPRPKYAYEVDEQVRVIDGPFANFTGVLDEVNSERGKVKVMISVFGRATPVELEFSQIEKV